MIVRLKGKKWRLPDVVQFGDSRIASQYFTYEAVDYRLPGKGEYYLSGAIPQAYLAPNDLSTPYLVVKKKTKMVRQQGWVPENIPKPNEEQILKGIEIEGSIVSNDLPIPTQDPLVFTRSTGEQILKSFAAKATERDSTVPPDTATGDQWAAWYKQQYGPIVESEMTARVTLAKRLRCPATWDHIIPAVESLIRQ